MNLFILVMISTIWNVDKVKAIKGIQITKNEAGNGAFREVVDCLVG